ncbi:hypothetical protein [Dyadobacter bucti]|uniref:hypothetical protein n=1 Tax=Dyadobacter bucti TaxID=2572203 RepID=UPI001108E420|nr:hypothetical protein [Dyadobacter bucti]
MANVTKAARSSRSLNLKRQIRRTFYAVYDCCISNNIPSCDVAFIEQRFGPRSKHERVASGEKYFTSLSAAQRYVKNHFKSGGEYFSLKQSSQPDNILHAIIDKITYLMA